MAGSIFQAFDNSATLTFTLNGLSNGATRYSTFVSSTSTATHFVDALVTASCYIATAPTSDQAVHFYAYGTVDGGTTFTDNVDGTDAALTTGTRNARSLGILSMTSPNVVMRGGPWSIAQAFGGVLPQRWGVIAVNSTGTYLSNANANANEVKYQHVWEQYT